MPHNKTLRFIIIAAGFVLTQMSLILYLPCQNIIGHDLGLSEQAIAYALSTSLIGYALGQLWWGTLSDIIGRKTALLIAAMGGGLAAIAIPYSNTALSFDITMAMLTFCQAAFTSIGYALIRESFPANKSAHIIATIGILMATTPVMVPLINQAIVDNFSWHWLFWGIACYNLSLSISLVLHIPNTSSQSTKRFDIKSMVAAYENPHYTRYCLTLALGFSTFLLFQQHGEDLFAYLLQTNHNNYASVYAIATAPYLISTIAVRQCLNYFSLQTLNQCGLYMLAIGYGIILTSHSLMPLHPTMAHTLPWIGIALSMLGTGIVMPTSKIGAMHHVSSQIGTAASVMKFTQIGISIIITWAATSFIPPHHSQQTLWLLALCALAATSISWALSKKHQSPASA
jgi:MFS transporter, DHA1 family, multidrug resistance protein